LGWAPYHCKDCPPPHTKPILTRLDLVQAYVSGTAIIILGGPQDILQTIYVDDVESLEAITIEETTGTIAVCGGPNAYIYKPYGREENVLKVRASA
jgi:CobQ-like glutamine amidotransferase family enzyme